MSGEMAVSSSLRETLIQIATLANDENVADHAKEKRLSELAAPAIQMLEQVIDNVGGTRRKLLEQIKGIIQSDDWAVLPVPQDIAITLKKIDRISIAIADVQKNLMADSTEIFRELMEIMRKMMIESKFAQSANHKLDIEAANSAAAAKKAANEKQLSSDLASSIAQGIGGIISAAGAIVSIRSVGKAALKAKEAASLAGSLQKNSENQKGILSKLDENLEAADSNISELSKSKRTSRAASEMLTDSENESGSINSNKKFSGDESINESSSDIGISEAESSSQKATSSSTEEISDMENESESIDNDDKILTKENNNKDVQETENNDFNGQIEKIEELRKSSDIHLAMGNAWQSLAGGISGLTNSVGGIAAALEKQVVGSKQLDADRDAINREVAQKMYQAAADSANSAREGLRSAIGMISAIEQTFAGMGSLLARNSV